MKAKYAAFLPHLACRSDLNRLIQWMCSELAVGHHRVGGGDFLGQPNRVPGGLLGADYAVENGRYRFKKIYGGLNWTPELRAPLAEPGSKSPRANTCWPSRAATSSARRPLRPLRVDGRQDRRDHRRTQRRPDGLADDQGRARRRRGRPAQPRLGRREHPQGPRGDERPGRLRLCPEHDDPRPRLLQALLLPPGRQGGDHRRRALQRRRARSPTITSTGSASPSRAYWAMRYGADLKTPSASIQGPKVMIVNETAGSGGDLLPYMWRKFGMGKLVGTATWGGLVGTWDSRRSWTAAR